ncbi:magnesium transporter, partial [Gloeocapsa sp. PCC 73106]|uniref:magnesium transporter n=1 Tax=Gloeocapsa sp. PCC 73106 TaxID=102232 RepID=UPI0002ACF15C
EAIEVYEYLDSRVQQILIEQFQDEEAIEIIDNISPDDRAQLFDELPPKIVRKLIAQLSIKEREATALILGYQKETAGRIMTPEYIALKQHLTIREAQEKIRSLAEQSEISYYLYVIDNNRKLLGTVSIKDLIIAGFEQTLEAIMNPDIVYAYTDTDQEEVARLIQRYDLIALPIVDKGENLLGIVTIDDIFDILQQETTEDIYRMGAIEPEGDNYFDNSLFQVFKQRIPWLLILLLTNSVTIFTMSNFEALLEAQVALAFFTPLLIDTGGNIGAQSATVVIRGLSTDELKNKKTSVVLIKELITGGLLGLILAILVIVGVLTFLGVFKLSLTVGITILVISTLAAVTGAALPFVFSSMGFDPALMSAPLITTVVDILGILIYFNLAKLLLGI